MQFVRNLRVEYNLAFPSVLAAQRLEERTSWLSGSEPNVGNTITDSNYPISTRVCLKKSGSGANSPNRGSRSAIDNRLE
ncbi:hypothetical protein NPIL_536721 [Nephila pilipes]|uniref:Uncharacterized protein n=1 Tax=Nephila pilipes TaxID=299642 RepID=A0A8X6PE74_NEPPI|nr:hypothetical protein NPIL_536721 [Nephila pilipes]